MANIKFSDFTVGNTEGDIDFVVGYKGANNIQISPTNLLASALGNYLPLAGGTMNAGSTVLFPDNSFLRFGTSADAAILHDSNHSYIKNYTGDLYIENFADDSDIIFKSDDGSGGVTTYFYLDGGGVLTRFSQRLRMDDNKSFQVGSNGDFEIYHNGTNTTLQNYTGNLTIRNDQNDGDIEFACDDGSGGVIPYFRLDGSQVETVVFKDFNFEDSVKAKFGSSADLQIYHDGSNTFFDNSVGDIYFRQDKNDGDVYFQCDNGSGALANYFYLDGSAVNGSSVLGATVFPDKSKIYMGTSGDLEIFHDGSNSAIENYTGNLELTQHLNDGDIIFKSDNMSGGTTEYLRLDGGIGETVFSRNTRHGDQVHAQFGDSNDLKIFHNSTDSFIINETGDFYISNQADNKDIVFTGDNGGGNTTTYFLLDGSLAAGGVPVTRFPDNSKLGFGDSTDLEIYHSGTASVIDNKTGHLYIKSTQTDGDIIFEADNSAGSVTEYFRLDGGDTRIKIPDNIIMTFGNGGDLQLSHSATDSLIRNYTGNLTITNFAGDKDIIFYSDDGSGGTGVYFLLDGSLADGSNKFTRFLDRSRVCFGDSADLQIYHDSANSYMETSASSAGDLYVKANGTGHDLYLQAADDIFIRPQGGEIGVKVTGNGGVELYHNNTKKFQTESTGVKITGVTEHADNTAAIAAGLTTGDVYRTGDLLKIVH